jgi:hypothetical protein
VDGVDVMYTETSQKVIITTDFKIKGNQKRYLVVLIFSVNSFRDKDVELLKNPK